jgi:hypothetical protein
MRLTQAKLAQEKQTKSKTMGGLAQVVEKKEAPAPCPIPSTKKKGTFFDHLIKCQV